MVNNGMVSDLQFGAVLSVIAGIFVNIGSGTLHLANGKKKLGEKMPRFSIGFAWLGLLVGTMIYIVALAFTPLTVVACLGSSHFIYNMMWYATFYKFKITIPNIIGACCLTVGCLIMVLDSPVRFVHAQHSSTQLFHLYSTEPYKIYLSFICIAYILLGGLAKAIECGYLVFLDCPIVSAFIFSVQSSMLGTQSIVLGKTIVGLLRLYLNGRINIFHPFNLIFLSIACIFCLISTLFWLWRNNISEQMFEKRYINPMNESLWIIFTIVSGGVYFQEFEETPVAQILPLCVALFFILSGTVLSHWGLYRDKNDEFQRTLPDESGNPDAQIYHRVATEEHKIVQRYKTDEEQV